MKSPAIIQSPVKTMKSPTQLKSLITWLITVLLLSCAPVSYSAQNFNVMVTIKPIHAIVMGLMKDVAKPELLINGKQTPFTFKLKPAQLTRMKKANLLIWVGPELEKTLQPAIAKLPKSVKVIELLSRDDLKILPSRVHPNQRNPFFWMDDRNAIILIDLLTEEFIKMDPEHAHIYKRNRLRILKPLKRIDKEFEYGYRGLKSGIGVQYYDTLYYFEQAYALKLLGQVTGTPWDKVSATNLLNVRQKLMSKQAVCLFVDRSMPADDVSLITSGLNVNIGNLDVFGQQFKPSESLYIKLMNFNTDAIKRCLNANMDNAAKARQEASEAEITEGDRIGGGHFILTDQYGRIVTDEDLEGHFSVIYFGYTSCPDICPTTLTVLTKALKILGKKAKNIQPYFISIDPHRDNTDVLRKFVKYFDPRLIGLTGSQNMIKRVAEQFKVRFQKGETDPGDPQQYTMSHTASLFLMAPDGRFITKLAYGLTPKALAKKLNEYTRTK